MKNIILAMVVFFAGVAAASEKGQDDTIRTFTPNQEMVKIMDHVFEVLK